MSAKKNLGFTIIELIISIALIAIITSVSFFNYKEFSSRSTLQVRVAELAEYVRFAQEQSASSKVLSVGADVPTAGFQVVRLKVRDGIFDSMRLEQVAKIGIDVIFSENKEVSPFKVGRDSDVPTGNKIMSRSADTHYIDTCFITAGATKYVREKLLVSASDTLCSSASMLCGSPDPSSLNFNRDEVRRNNFDVHFSIEQPTREVYVNVIPVHEGSYKYYAAEPNGSDDEDKNTSSRISDLYVGIRVVFIEPGGLKRSVDVYTITGLIGTKAADSGDGCG